MLLATTRNISQPTGEWRLISERALGMHAHSIVTDVLYVHNNRRRGFNSALHAWADEFSSVSYRGAIGMAAALLKALGRIRKWLRRNPDGYVIVSGLQLYPLTTVLPRSRVVIDNHGTLKEWTEIGHPAARQRLQRYLYPVAAWLDRIALEHSKGALVTSMAQRDHVLSNGAAAAWLVPCVLSAGTAKAYSAAGRQASRDLFGIRGNTTVMVYCGGFSAWQCVRDAVHFFRLIRPYLNTKALLVMITPSVASAVQAAEEGGVHDAIAMTLPPAEVPGALMACDVGLMLRETTLTNHFAFPNKFTEYLAAGLYILSSPGLTDPASLIRQHRLGALISPEELRQGIAPERLASIAEQLYRSGGRERRWRQIRPLLDFTLSMESRTAGFVYALNGRREVQVRMERAIR
ncbi:MAG TPA: hypothetical protein VMQ86_14445 [Bryobacteraceae bacterium]|jgi:hypothetical protein|nr:hypothetical protein [Bryobacteraceae bacterium]